MVVDARCHSFEESSAAGDSRNTSFLLSSRSESSRDNGSVKLTEFATITLPLLESPAGFQISLPQQLRANSRANSPPSFNETRTVSPGRGRAATRSPARNALGRPASPDRFIPKRAFVDPPSTSYRVSKPPQQLSPQQRLLRQRLPGDDPFLPLRPRRPVTVPGPPRPIRLWQRPYQRPHLVSDTAVVERAGYLSNDSARVVSAGAVWGVGGVSGVLGPPSTTLSNDHPSVLNRGTTAPMYAAQFLPQSTITDQRDMHESRLALALDIDPTTRLLDTCMLSAGRATPPSPASSHHERYSPFVWKDNAWKKVERGHWPTSPTKGEVVPPKPFRILDAPFLRNDFYCSTLAYSFTSGVLAVGLAQRVYIWSERFGVEHPPFGDMDPSNYVTSLSFSSEVGGKSILAVARQSGQLSLWSIFDSEIRFELNHSTTITCVSFKPKTTRRPSYRFEDLEVEAEDLVVGDEIGDIWYYSVEWSDDESQNQLGWKGSITLLVKISAHTQQVCGLAWSPDDTFLATGGNDNSCLLFELNEIISSQTLPSSAASTESTVSTRASPNIFQCITSSARRQGLFRTRHFFNHWPPLWMNRLSSPPSEAPSLSEAPRHGSGRATLVPATLVPYNCQKHRLAHAAAVKAIAFAPWQPSLLATGGGINDGAIHFYHTRTGACLATINVFAQVTSLIWSQTRREIVATFGFALPQHPYRIAIFAWPSCAQVAVIPWGPYGTSWDGQDRGAGYDCGRALWAVSYPGRPPRRVSATLDDWDSLHPPLSPERVPPTTERRNRRGRRYRPGPLRIRPKEKEGGMWCTGTREEGCIIVASSDQTVKFHEVWSGRRQSIGSAYGLLGGSDILEGLEGIEKSGSEIIR